MRSRQGAVLISLWAAAATTGCAPLHRGSGGESTRELPSQGSGAPLVAHQLTAVDLESFLDGLVPLQIERADIAGATIAVVKDGKVLFAKGYGYADSARKQPVSPDSTLFRGGSISKLFTWTAVMQLVEQGKLDLDRDVNAYLDFQLPRTFGRPLTLRNIMTHRTGFEETIKDLLVPAPGSPNLRDWLAAHVPRQIYPPGTVPAYSNYGAATAGYIVQRVSGRPFEQYIAENIFTPLGMTHSTFEEPLPGRLKPLMSDGFARASDRPKPFEVLNGAPAGSLASSALDMARFMIAHLHQGQLGDARILRAETAQEMHRRQIGADPRLPGMALGFYEESRNGHRIIGHGGDTQWFHSDLHLIPDADLGFFVSYNSAGRSETPVRTELWNKVLDRYFPYQPPAASTLPSAAQDARAAAGAYRSSRRSEASFFKLPYLMIETVVSAMPDGAIEISEFQDLNGRPTRWREVGPLVFQDVNGQDQVIFQRETGAGDGLTMVTAEAVSVEQRAAWFADKRVLLAVVAFSLAVSALTLALWPVAALVRRHYRRPLALDPGQRRRRLGVRLVCLLNLFSLVALGGTTLYGFGHLGRLNDDLDPWLRFLEAVGALGAVGTLGAGYGAYGSWVERWRSIWSKLQETIMALACLGFVWIGLMAHLFNFNLRY